jgi:hypothetical protein
MGPYHGSGGGGARRYALEAVRSVLLLSRTDALVGPDTHSLSLSRSRSLPLSLSPALSLSPPHRRPGTHTLLRNLYFNSGLDRS